MTIPNSFETTRLILFAGGRGTYFVSYIDAFVLYNFENHVDALGAWGGVVVKALRY